MITQLGIELAFPLLSLIVPFHDSYKWLDDTLKSISKQTFNDFEVVFVDDYSNVPLTTTRLKKLTKPFRLYRHSYNRGLSHTRNTGARLARGKFIIFLDPDDTISPTCLEKLILKQLSA